MTHEADGTSVHASTTHGPIRGHWQDGVARFAGIPYAAPPVDELRFRPPAPVVAWTDERSAESFGPICPQNPSMMDALFGGDSERWDEDCLYLNVWTTSPAASDEVPADESVTDHGPLPVMVWIHGGGFEMGSGSSPLYDGTQFAHSGVVLVTLNYRLGSLGFLELGQLDPSFENSGNVGLLDQVAALEWVQANIAQFGGDPANVTVFGQSAGSMSVSLLMAAPQAKGLFSKAIAQSGSTNAGRTVELARSDGDDFLAIGGWSSIAELQAAPTADLLAAHGAMTAARSADPESYIRRAGSPLGFLSFRPVADGTFIPTDALSAIAEGSAPGVSLLIGTTSQEWRLFAMMTATAQSPDELHARFELLVTDTDEALRLYHEEYADAALSDVEGALLTDLVFRLPAVRLADVQSAHAPTYQYLWDWKSEAFGGLIGAAHAIDIPFVFNLLEDQRLHIFVGPDAPRPLAHATNEAWINFARTGVPSAKGLPEWPALGSGSGRPVMVLDTESHLEDDPNGGTRQFWDTPGAVMPTPTA